MAIQDRVQDRVQDQRQDPQIDEDSISYNGKTFEKGDTVKWLRNKEGKLIKIGRKRVIVLRNDNHKERRLKVDTFIKLNF